MRFISRKLMVLAFLLSANSSLFALTKYQSVNEMITAQKTIRVLMDEAPGFGNQAATINLMNRMRLMRFQGTFEVIYPDLEQEKMIQLFNLPQTLPDVYHYQHENQTIDFVRESYYMRMLKQRQVVPVELAVSGAHDMETESDCYDKEYCSPRDQCDDNNGPCTIYKNLAEFTNASVYLQLQPWLEQKRRRDYLITPNTVKQVIEPMGRYWIYPFADFAAAKKYVDSMQNRSELGIKQAGLKRLFDRIEQQQINFLPLYGYPFLKEVNMPENNEFDFPQNILEVLSAARYTQLQGGDFNKPLVIAMFYDYQDESAELSKLLQGNGWEEYEPMGGEQARTAIRTLGLSTSQIFSIVSLSDANAAQKIQSLQPGQIVLLTTGSLPKIVFDGLYTYTGPNAWPAVREGEGSLSMLLQTGKPHFRCITYYNTDYSKTRWEMGFKLVKNEVFKKQFMDFYSEKNGFCAVNSWKTDPLFYKKLSGYIVDAKNSASPISQYFSDIKADMQLPRNDRIYRGLEEAAKTMK